MNLSIQVGRRYPAEEPIQHIKAKGLRYSGYDISKMVVVICNDAEIEVEDGEICQICGCELEEFDQVTGTGIHGYYHWTCVTHVD